MKFKITMKDTGAVDDAVEDFDEDTQEELKEIIKKWFRWSEYLTVEIDTVAGTCVVVPVGKEG